MTVKELIEELENFEETTEVEVMIGFSCVPIRNIGGDDEEGVYLEIDE